MNNGMGKEFFFIVELPDRDGLWLTQRRPQPDEVVYAMHFGTYAEARELLFKMRQTYLQERKEERRVTRLRMVAFILVAALGTLLYGALKGFT